MATIHRDGNVDLLSGKVAVIGYGSQGHAHALNLRDSGVEVEVGLREGSASRRCGGGSRPDRRAPSARPSQGAQVVAILLPDQVQPAVYEADDRAEPRARTPRSCSRTASTSTTAASSRPPGHDVIMVAPKGPGHIVRAPLRSRGSARPRSSPSHQDASGQARELALAYGDRDRLRRARACSRRRSPRRPRPTSSASRPCSAAASPS